MKGNDLFQKLYTLLDEEADLAARDNPALPEGKIGYKKVRRYYLTKDGTKREYQYRYQYYAYDGKQKYLNRKDGKKVSQIVIARARLRMVREALRAVIEALNRQLPEGEQLTLDAARQTFAQNKAQLSEIARHSTGEKREIHKPCIAADGTAARSRVEVIVLNLLLSLHIAFLYEPKFFTPNGLFPYRRPDFCVLTPKGIVYIEVMGMWENADYRREQEEKLRDYKKAGLEIGKNLIVIQVSDEQEINSQVIYYHLQNLFSGILPDTAIAA